MLSAGPHTWKRSFGSGHAALGLREDWLDQLKQACAAALPETDFHAPVVDEARRADLALQRGMAGQLAKEKRVLQKLNAAAIDAEASLTSALDVQASLAAELDISRNRTPNAARNTTPTAAGAGRPSSLRDDGVRTVDGIDTA